MRCPCCQREELKVTDSRNAPEVNAIRRRRECLHCAARFTTFETIELALQIHKRDGRYEDFTIQKLIKGMSSACQHTSIGQDAVTTIANEIAGDLAQRQQRTISSQTLGQIVMNHLLQRDKIAYIRFACVYCRVKEIDELAALLGDIEQHVSKKTV